MTASAMSKVIDGHQFEGALIWEEMGEITGDDDDVMIHGVHVVCITCDPHAENVRCFLYTDYEDEENGNILMMQDADVFCRLHALATPGLV